MSQVCQNSHEANRTNDACLVRICTAELEQGQIGQVLAEVPRVTATPAVDRPLRRESFQPSRIESPRRDA